MLLPRLLPQSLKSRVTLLTLAIVVLAFWALSSYIKVLLRDELILYTGAQQRSALKLLGAEVSRGLQDRLDSLSALASEIGPARMQDTRALNEFLRGHSVLGTQFNAGVSIWNAQGVLLASNERYWDRSVAAQDVLKFLQTGQPGVGRMNRVTEPQTAAFALYVPLHSPSGTVVGAIAGSIRLDQPNFLTALVSHSYGKTGNFFLVEAAQRLIIATSDEARVFEVLPARGAIAWIDRFVDGYQGTARVVNPHGVEVLVSIEQIPLAHWYASVTLTPDEVFELIDTLKPRGRIAAFLLAAVSLSLIWFMLRLQLSPISAAVKTLDGFVRKNQPPQALPIKRMDEVGQLVSGFNRLLDSLVQQKKVAQDSEVFTQAVLNSMTSAIAVLGHDGSILSVNEAWGQLHHKFTALPGSTETGAGSNLLTALAGLPVPTTQNNAPAAEEGVRAVLQGQLPHFHLEYSVGTGSLQHWRSMKVSPIKGAAFQGAVVSIEDISERIEMQRRVRELASYDPLTQLPNRRLALERLAQQLVRARRAKTRLALLFIDLDRFKPINDELGHEMGDWLLQAVAQRIHACVRESDTAARMGGDEFVVLLPDLQTAEDAAAVGEKIRHALEQDFVTPKGLVLHISSSIGVAVYPDHGASEEALLRLGDEAMYKAKRSGRNAVQIWAPVTPAEAQASAHHPEQRAHLHLRWQPAFTSGHAVIDQAHEALFDLANVLLDMSELRESNPAAFEAAADALLAHAAQHFAQEESILQAYGFKDLGEHARMHQSLLDRASTIRVTARASDVDTVNAWVRFLVYELASDHVLGADRAFASLFAIQAQV